MPRTPWTWGSNLGTKALTQGDRSALAKYLYKDREWSQEKVAEALGLSQSTVSRELFTVNNSTRRGRPRKSVPTLSPEHDLSLTPEQQGVALEMLEGGSHKVDVAKAIGTSDMPVRRLIERERGRREVRAGLTCPNCGHHFSAERST
jgi:predicted transcriptional regulator